MSRWNSDGRDVPPPTDAAFVASAIGDARILIVDDNDFNRALLVAMLRSAGFHNLHLANDGQEALDRVAQIDPDLVILDLLMPGLDGYAVTRQLRANPRFVDLPILVQTALAGASQRGEAFQAGATDLVIKPVDRVELLARASLHLQTRQMIRDLRSYHERTRAELELAKSVYRQLLPTEEQLAAATRQTGLSVVHRASLTDELGGTLWGVRVAPGGQLAVYLLDIAGRGVTAALDAIRVHALLDDVVGQIFAPAQFLSALNRMACGLFELGHYATALAAVIDQRAGAMVYASAAAANPVMVSGLTAQRLGGNSLPLGVSPVALYEQYEVPIQPETVMVFGAGGSLEGVVPTIASTLLPTSQQADQLLSKLLQSNEGIKADTTLLCVFCQSQQGVA